MMIAAAGQERQIQQIPILSAQSEIQTKVRATPNKVAPTEAKSEKANIEQRARAYCI
jgi:hypothetical protein